MLLPKRQGRLVLSKTAAKHPATGTGDLLVDASWRVLLLVDGRRSAYDGIQYLSPDLICPTDRVLLFLSLVSVSYCPSKTANLVRVPSRGFGGWGGNMTSKVVTLKSGPDCILTSRPMLKSPIS